MTKLSIIIPVYNEELFIKKAIYKVIKVNLSNIQKEIIIIDDGSFDNTPKIINTTVKSLKNILKKNTIKIITNKQNLGKGASVKKGLLSSTGDIVLIQDADLEYSPEDYPILLEPFLKHGADVVFGSRFISNRPHRVFYFWHYQVNVWLTLLSNMLTNLNLTDIETGYKVIRGDLAREIAKDLKSKGFGFEPEITARLAKVKSVKFYEVGISYFGRTYQEGKKVGGKMGLGQSGK